MQTMSVEQAMDLADVCNPVTDGLKDSLKALAEEVRRLQGAVPEGYVRDGAVDRKVLGTLPITADGCVVGVGATLHDPYVGAYCDLVMVCPVGNRYTTPNIASCYSTREAALAARAKGGA